MLIHLTESSDTNKDGRSPEQHPNSEHQTMMHNFRQPEWILCFMHNDYTATAVWHEFLEATQKGRAHKIYICCLVFRWCAPPPGVRAHHHHRHHRQRWIAVIATRWNCDAAKQIYQMCVCVCQISILPINLASSGDANEIKSKMTENADLYVYVYIIYATQTTKNHSNVIANAHTMNALVHV